MASASVMVSKDKPCPLLVSTALNEIPAIPHLKRALEDNDVATKIDALKKTILLMLSGEPATQLIMTIIRFVLPSKDRTIKKLLLLYWEVVDKKAADGKLLHEMILVCNALMRDLTHPNEYIRGSTLRLVGKLKEPELVEPLIESIKLNLQQRHSYVRRNAVLAIYSIYKDMPQLIPDAGEIIRSYLEGETDASCKRNAFLMLFNTHPDDALEYLMSIMDQVSSFGEILQLIVLEMIRRVSKQSNSSNKSNDQSSQKQHLGARRLSFIRVIFTLLSSSVKSPAVQFEAAVTLLSLSRAPTAIKAASQALINILLQASDNNIKMVVLDKIAYIKMRHGKVLQEQVMDILRVLTSNPNMEIVKKTLSIALDLVTPKNIVEVISLLKKEILKSQSEEFEKGGEYRQILISAIRNTSIQFPDIASDVVHQLIEFLGDSNANAALDVVLFVREVMHRYEHLRASIIQSILDSYFDSITSPTVFTPVLWLIGEYSESESLIRLAVSKLSELLVGTNEKRSIIDGISYTSNDTTSQNGQVANVSSAASQTSSKPIILQDGSYASSSALVPQSSSHSSHHAPSSAQLSNIVKSGALAAADYFLAASAATSLTKLALRCRSLHIHDSNILNAKILLVLVRFVRLRNQTTLKQANNASNSSQQTSLISTTDKNVAAIASIATPLAVSSATAAMSVVDPDSFDWFVSCINLLTYKKDSLPMHIFLKQTRKAFMDMMEKKDSKQDAMEDSEDSLNTSENQIEKFQPSSNNKITSAMKSTERKQIKEQSGAVQVDASISFPLLKDRRGGVWDVTSDANDDEDEDGIFSTSSSSVTQTSSSLLDNKIAGSIGATDLSSRLNRVVQLTGLSDSLYVEAVLVVHQFDISLEITIINQTSDTLQNLTLELATLGDLKLVERPTHHNLGPLAKLVLTQHVAISSTETGTVFGAIVYDVAGSNALSGNIVVLNEIHIDMIDYIQPALCEDASFRSMWQSFEWDTKVSVSSESTLRNFLQHVIQVTNMHCLTPISKAIDESCGFLAANLYAKSKFGEDALANLSIQRVPGNPNRIQGFIRIRAETRGVADSLHAKILQKMKQ